ncbi:hypothetical protein HYT26_03655, partial [Candidatus Pacearchaeota archaeon]|nr:hypothetical protein [Candidatus Pacearchaeota archaeon]
NLYLIEDTPAGAYTIMQESLGRVGFITKSNGEISSEVGINPSNYLVMLEDYIFNENERTFTLKSEIGTETPVIKTEAGKKQATGKTQEPAGTTAEPDRSDIVFEYQDGKINSNLFYNYNLGEWEWSLKEENWRKTDSVAEGLSEENKKFLASLNREKNDFNKGVFLLVWRLSSEKGSPLILKFAGTLKVYNGVGGKTLGSYKYNEANENPVVLFDKIIKLIEGLTKETLPTEITCSITNVELFIKDEKLTEEGNKYSLSNRDLFYVQLEHKDCETLKVIIKRDGNNDAIQPLEIKKVSESTQKFIFTPLTEEGGYTLSIYGNDQAKYSLKVEVYKKLVEVIIE